MYLFPFYFPFINIILQMISSRMISWSVQNILIWCGTENMTCILHLTFNHLSYHSSSRALGTKKPTALKLSKFYKVMKSLRENVTAWNMGQHIWSKLKFFWLSYPIFDILISESTMFCFRFWPLECHILTFFWVCVCKFCSKFFCVCFPYRMFKWP